MLDGKIQLWEDRKFQMVPINLIKVLNSRNRDKQQFQENIKSIKNVGLKKPILVNEKYFSKTHFYELVCGQGRYLAYKSLNYTHIPAEIINCDRKKAHIYSLVENIARVPPGTMWFAREIKRLFDAGWTFPQISKIIDRSETHVRDYLKLVEQGEERLIKGVESGLFPVNFALMVARSDDSVIQNILMDGFDNGIINAKNIHSIRKIIQERMNRGKATQKNKKEDYTMTQLKKDIKKVTRRKDAFVQETQSRENRLFILIDELATLRKDSRFLDLLEKEKLNQKPELKGGYNGYER
jgi:ParB family chromosome partitioning protein